MGAVPLAAVLLAAVSLDAMPIGAAPVGAAPLGAVLDYSKGRSCALILEWVKRNKFAPHKRQGQHHLTAALSL